jgi:hypothetical protein
MNNFDTNSKGLNIDLTIMRDEFQAQMRFDENFKRIDDNDNYLYIDFENLSSDFIVTINEEHNEKLKKVVIDNDLNYNFDSDELENYQFIECIESNFENVELYNFCLKNDIAIEERYEIVTVTGYSQGDNATVLINTIEFKTVMGNDFDSTIHGAIFTNYFYNQPIDCRLTVNDNEYIVELKNEYEYYDSEVQDEIITWCCNNIEVEDKDLLKSELKNLLPSDLY